MMKRPFLLLLALFAGPLAHAEWLTLTGSAGEAANSYVQVDPTSVVVDGSKRLVIEGTVLMGGLEIKN